MAVEAKRKAQLIAAAIAEIGEAGSLEVTVSRIAKRAGVSPALAFHYFGDKDRLFLAAMRHILAQYGSDVRRALQPAQGPRARLDALIGASFGPANFERGAAAAWLNFYVLAQHGPEARRLLTVYQRRLHSNLLHDLRPLAGERSETIARRIGALIDGLYLRSVHAVTELSREEAAALVRQTLAQSLDAVE